MGWVGSEACGQCSLLFSFSFNPEWSAQHSWDVHKDTFFGKFSYSDSGELVELLDKQAGA